MKTTTKASITAAQKRYLHQQIVHYHLLLLAIDTRQRRLKKIPPKQRRVSRAKHQVSSKRTKKSADDSALLAVVLDEIGVQPDSTLREEKSAVRSIPRQAEKTPFIEPKSRRHFIHFHWKRSVLAASVALLLLVFAQLIYPHDRALPLSRLETAGHVGFADKNAILDRFTDFDNRLVTVHTHSKTVTTSYSDLGVRISPEGTVESLTEYTWRERLIPMSIFYKGYKEQSIQRSLDEDQLALFVKNIIAQSSEQPIDALVSLSGTTLEVSPSKAGYEYQPDVLRSRVLSAKLSDREQIVFTPTVLQPRINTEVATAAVQRMQLRINNPLTILADTKTRQIDSETMASWLDIQHKPNEGIVELVFNRARVDVSLRSLSAEVDYPAVPAVITMLNGAMAGRQEGSTGRSLQYDDLLNRIVGMLSPLSGNIEANVVVVPPPEEIRRTYTRDSQGLQSLLSFWTSQQSGQFSIDIRSMNGKIAASANPHRLLPSIGIYRLYVASLVYGRVSAGSLAMGTMTQAGQTVEVCLDQMLRESEEACSYALSSLVGFSSADSMLRAQGFGSTTLAENSSLTTANDTTNWFMKLEEGSLTRRDQADSIYAALANSSFRAGMPSGSPDVMVSSKFGSFGRYTHDVGKVYHPSGSYVVSILSEGGTASQIADLAREIYAVMSQ